MSVVIVILTLKSSIDWLIKMILINKSDFAKISTLSISKHQTKVAQPRIDISWQEYGNSYAIVLAKLSA